MTKKDLLIKMTHEAYNGDEMSLLCGVYARRWVPPDNLIRDPEHDLTEEMAKKKAGDWYKSIWDILEHTAKCKAMYMTQAFGDPPSPFPEIADSLSSLLAYLEAVQQCVIENLHNISEEALAEPVNTTCHGESAANLFWILARHDVHHGSQVKLLRRYLSAIGNPE